MTELIGTARIDLVFDTTEYETRIAAARNSAYGLGDTAQQAFAQATGSIKSASTSLLRYAETLGRSADEVRLLRAAWAGVDVSIIDEVRAKMIAHRADLEAAAQAAREAAAAEELLAIKAKHAADGADFERMANEAERLRRGAQAVQVFTEHLELMDIKAKHAADGLEFERMANEAERLRRGAQAVAAFTEHLDLLDIKAQHAADGAEFERLANEAERLRRGAQAVAVFTAELDRLEAEEAQLAQQTNFLRQLEGQTAAMGKTRAELMEMKAAELGVTQAAAPFIAQLKAQENALYGTANKLNQYGLSAKQVQLALRNVPAQITDIFVSLQGGQNPLTVLLQQGGQLKDLFGGIAPAVSALARGLLGLINPTTLLAGGAAALTAAWVIGERETNGYAQALALTGHHMDATVSSMARASVAIQDYNTTQHQAALVLAEVARSGKFTGDQLQLVAEAAINMERATGQAIDKTIDQFAALATEPTAAVAKLNEQTHFLTLAVYEQIKALEEQGDTQAAASLAMESYADTVNQRTADVEQSLGTLQTAWREITRVAKAAWDAMLDIGREDTTSDRITQLSDDIVKLKEDGFAFLQYGGIGSDARKAEIAKRRTELQALIRQERDENRAAYMAAAKQEGIDYAVAQDQKINAHRSADDKRAHEIERSAHEAALKAAKALEAGDQELHDKILANQKKYEEELRAEGKKKGNRSGLALQNAEARADLQEFKDILAEQQGAIRNDTQLLQAQYGARLITVADYYAKQKELTQRDTQAQEQAILGQIGVLQRRNVVGKEAVNVQRQLHQLESQLAKVRAEGATAIVILGIQEADAAEKRAQAVALYKQSLDVSTLALQQQMDAQAEKIGMSEKEFEKQQALNAVYRESADQLRELANKLSAREIEPDRYKEEVEAVKSATDAKVAIIEDGYDRMAEAERDWRAGMEAGLQDWIDAASNTAGQVRAVMVKGLDTISETLDNFALHGEFKWKEMLASIAADIEKFLMRQAVAKFATMLLQYFGGTSDYNYGGDADWVAAQGGPVASGSQVAPSVGTGGGQAMVVPEITMAPLTQGSRPMPGASDLRGGTAPAINVSVSTTLHADGTSKSEVTSTGDQDASVRQFTDRMRQVAQEELQRATRPGGTLWKVGVTTR